MYHNEECESELHIEKSTSPAQDVPYHGVVIYAVALTNTGGSPAANACLTHVLPAHVAFARWIGDEHGATQEGGTLAWTGEIAAGHCLSWTWAATHTGTQYGKTITTTATYEHPCAGTGSDSARFTVENAPSLTIGKAVTLDTGVSTGDSVTYTVMIENTSRVDASGVWLTDTLPSEVDFDRWVQQNGANVSDDVITWNGTIPGGTMATWQQLVTVVGGPQGTVVNTARLDAPAFDQNGAASAELSGSQWNVYCPIIFKNV